MGEIVAGNRHGVGQLSSSHGMVFLGQWVEGQRHGRGVERDERQGHRLWKTAVEFRRDREVLRTPLFGADHEAWVQKLEAKIKIAIRASKSAVPAIKLHFYPGPANPEGVLVYVGGLSEGERSGYVRALCSRAISPWL